MDLAHTYLGEKVIEQGLKFIVKRPMDNMDRILEWVEKLPMAPHQRADVQSVK
ncbi:MAG: hypothetical protein PWQ68_1148, partial [Thermoanaerobacteraceae bacterium]|nr:hypothetical protein [Thermoanaerobacteraceae bacterium]